MYHKLEELALVLPEKNKSFLNQPVLRGIIVMSIDRLSEIF